MNDDRPMAQVSQHSRESGRVPVHVLVEKLKSELSKIGFEKRDVERRLMELEEWKIKKTKEALSSRTHVNQRVEATVGIEDEYNDRRRPLKRELYAIEERINDIKARLKILDKPKPSEQTEALLRIESLLQQILKVLSAKR